MTQSFDEFINTSELPVLVDFWASWCGPCLAMEPVIKQIAKEYSGRIITIKVNVEEKQQIATKYQIGSIPTTMMFLKGRSIMYSIGYQTVDEFRILINEQLQKLSL